MWKFIYGLATLKIGEDDSFKGIDKDEGEVEKKVEEA